MVGKAALLVVSLFITQVFGQIGLTRPTGGLAALHAARYNQYLASLGLAGTQGTNPYQVPGVVVESSQVVGRPGYSSQVTNVPGVITTTGQLPNGQLTAGRPGTTTVVYETIPSGGVYQVPGTITGNGQLVGQPGYSNQVTYQTAGQLPGQSVVVGQGPNGQLGQGQIYTGQRPTGQGVVGNNPGQVTYVPGTGQTQIVQRPPANGQTGQIVYQTPGQSQIVQRPPTNGQNGQIIYQQPGQTQIVQRPPANGQTGQIVYGTPGQAQMVQYPQANGQTGQVIYGTPGQPQTVQRPPANGQTGQVVYGTPGQTQIVQHPQINGQPGQVIYGTPGQTQIVQRPPVGQVGQVGHVTPGHATQVGHVTPGHATQVGHVTPGHATQVGHVTPGHATQVGHVTPGHATQVGHGTSGHGGTGNSGQSYTLHTDNSREALIQVAHPEIERYKLEIEKTAEEGRLKIQDSFDDFQATFYGRFCSQLKVKEMEYVKVLVGGAQRDLEHIFKNLEKDPNGTAEEARKRADHFLHELELHLKRCGLSQSEIDEVVGHARHQLYMNIDNVRDDLSEKIRIRESWKTEVETISWKSNDHIIESSRDHYSPTINELKSVIRHRGDVNGHSADVVDRILDNLKTSYHNAGNTACNDPKKFGDDSRWRIDVELNRVVETLVSNSRMSRHEAESIVAPFRTELKHNINVTQHALQEVVDDAAKCEVKIVRL